MPIQELNPSACSMWDLHQRLGEDVTLKTCAQLLESIRANGQRLPVLGRSSTCTDGAPVELIYGARRLFVARTLGIKLIVDVRALDDRAALIEMDLENRLRMDISPYERGLSYRRWLTNRIFKTQTELSKALAISEAQVSRLLSFAELPAAVIGAFQSPSAIREEWAVAIAQQCRDPERKAAILRRARAHARAGERISSPQVFASLIEDGDLTPKPGAHDRVVKDAAGVPVMRIAFRTDAVHFIVPRAQLSDDALEMITERVLGALKAIVNDVVQHAEENGADPTLLRRGNALWQPSGPRASSAASDGA